MLRCRYNHKSGNSKFFSRKSLWKRFARIDLTKIYGNGEIIGTFITSHILQKDSTLNIKHSLSYGHIILKANTF